MDGILQRVTSQCLSQELRKRFARLIETED